jgi:hypothetical protein
VHGREAVDDHDLLARATRRRSPANARGCRFAANASAPIIQRESAEKDEEEKTRVGRRTRPPTLLQLVRIGSDAADDRTRDGPEVFEFLWCITAPQ